MRRADFRGRPRSVRDEEVTPSAADAAAPLPLAGEVDALDRARRVGVPAKQHALPVERPHPSPPPQAGEGAQRRCRGIEPSIPGHSMQTADAIFKQPCPDALLRLAARCARAIAGNFRPHERARGMPGAQCTAAWCAHIGSEYAHQYSQRRHRKHPAFPTQWFYGLLRALPGDRAFLPPSSGTFSASQPGWAPRDRTPNLTPASGRQDHTASPSATLSLVSHAAIARELLRPATHAHTTSSRPPHPAPRS